MLNTVALCSRRSAMAVATTGSANTCDESAKPRLEVRMTEPFSRHLYVLLDCARSDDRASLHAAPVTAPRLVPQRVSWARATPLACVPRPSRGGAWGGRTDWTGAHTQSQRRRAVSRPGLHHQAAVDGPPD